MKLNVLLAATGAAGLALAAAPALAQSAPPIPSATVTALPIVQQNPAVLERDGTYSAAIGGKSYWAFNDTALSMANASGQNFFSNSLSWSTSLSAANGISLNADQVDSSGLPTQFIPFTAQEATFNSEHAGSHGSCQVKPCGEGLAIWPGPIVYVPTAKQVLIPFVEIIRGGPVNGFQSVGGGIAVGTVTPTGFDMTRPVQSTGYNPALLWQKGSMVFTDQAFLNHGYYYAYGSKNVFVTTEAVLARVPVSQVLNLSAWTYYIGNGQWGADVNKAVTVFEGSASGSSVFFDHYLNEWVLIYSQNFSNNIYYAVAYAPQGPFSASTLLTVGPSGYNNNADYATRAHPEFSPDGGKTIPVTTVHSTGAFGQDLPSWQVVFGPPQ
jgi:hypothetical protein